ncbi:AimR family lysis-lysogeny pheromone receptor [Bacillus cereus]|uniref:Prophage helix-turn-helix protein n=1 Tax=Bacillus cereus (strain ATCC 14579 / DSM 31 / CCUG 7414 / JCM 2152 / NBRC 15305 / NCIMB 9373 / NCTC 2599 / NRRL B-3711) TaxID=226900 RepID=Q81D26_BACCR|nr:AimR family lysis-lysogeny pheromone receptor [Bacillus cereus]NP_852562.1 helix-turn-helix protein [Bacillus phage phBC6A52]AAP09516.1 Prophage helix-turn-helix protein [Bacillus cereus ATCC 14579]EEL11383.1 Prophage helix-turn-helix protein [Bacillus cereus BDRD-Cer4]MCM3325206.1 AimR family lysis-lysogeny pheromone receptor [Bacillus cereus]MCU4789038.1 AimR family lysis-lysogeny pheromone receptor [Bacillus cereus]MEB9995272.1 AimR family lysis-lysogeny pheromone receptor [Bacillus cer
MQVLLDLNDMQECLKSNGYTNRKLATRFKVTHTTVNSYFKKQGKFDFMHLVDALKLYKPKNVDFRRECIKECIPTLSHKNLKLALEVLDMFGEYDLQDLVIQRIMSFKTNKNKSEEEKKKGNSKTVRINLNLVPLYKTLRERSENTTTPKRFFEKVDKMRKNQKYSDNELVIISVLNTIYSFFDLGNYKMVNEHIQQLLPDILGIKCHTLRDSLLLRIKEMEVFVALHENNLDESRELCFEIINDQSNCYVSTKAVAYCKIGESYIFSDYQNAKEYMEKSLNIIGVPVNKKLEVRREKVLNTLLFLRIYHEKDLHTINPENLDDAEKAFLYVKLGENQKAIKILQALQNTNGYLSSFQLYYMGLAVGGEEGKKYLEMSIESFSKSGDYFYIFLPKTALKCYN